MPVIAMRAVDKTAHDKTDNLFIYTFESPALGRRQIVANKDNAYEIGDIAGVALVGTFLPGVEIKPRKVFGVHSEGMALGKVDVPPDTDVTGRFDADAAPRAFAVTITVEVEARYAEDAARLARKAIKAGKGSVVSAEAVAAGVPARGD